MRKCVRRLTIVPRLNGWLRAATIEMYVFPGSGATDEVKGDELYY